METVMTDKPKLPETHVQPVREIFEALQARAYEECHYPTPKDTVIFAIAELLKAGIWLELIKQGEKRPEPKAAMVALFEEVKATMLRYNNKNWKPDKVVTLTQKDARLAYLCRQAFGNLPIKESYWKVWGWLITEGAK
ncbi:hypothetical protein GCM10007901_06290 [Dyella acidisoli]|uniref:Uncharacterized protein n=2 Tax=Dyella acidisoli TaxID=1867834 RepID=A0ABQ5XJ16_9GAMM|nr:hypothetical protein GCM10007901_06290 [Dyella acidisoli]